MSYLTTGEVREDGTRTVFFELNGQPRDIRVLDRSVEGAAQAPSEGRPRQRRITSPRRCRARSRRSPSSAGQEVKTGERLLSIEAMKMETAVYSPRDAIVAEVLVTPGSVVEARDLLVVLKDA